MASACNSSRAPARYNKQRAYMNTKLVSPIHNQQKMKMNQHLAKGIALPAHRLVTNLPDLHAAASPPTGQIWTQESPQCKNIFSDGCLAKPEAGNNPNTMHLHLRPSLLPAGAMLGTERKNAIHQVEGTEQETWSGKQTRPAEFWLTTNMCLQHSCALNLPNVLSV